MKVFRDAINNNTQMEGWNWEKQKRKNFFFPSHLPKSNILIETKWLFFRLTNSATWRGSAETNWTGMHLVRGLRCRYLDLPGRDTQVEIFEMKTKCNRFGGWGRETDSPEQVNQGWKIQNLLKKTLNAKAPSTFKMHNWSMPWVLKPTEMYSSGNELPPNSVFNAMHILPRKGRVSICFPALLTLCCKSAFTVVHFSGCTFWLAGVNIGIRIHRIITETSDTGTGIHPGR